MTTLMRRNNGSLDVRDPLVDLDRAVAEVDTVLNRVFESLGRNHSTGWSRFTPLADIEETDDAFIVEVELPGIDRRDASAEVRGRRLVVTGERKERERKGIFRTKTRVTGRFHYEAVLPTDVDADGVVATYQDGVLTVRLPKPASEVSRARRIEIH